MLRKFKGSVSPRDSSCLEIIIAMIIMATLTALDQISIGAANRVFSLFAYGTLTIIYMVLCAANRSDFYKRCPDRRNMMGKSTTDDNLM